MTEQNPRNQTALGSTIQMLQLVVLIIGVAGIFLTIGRKDQALETNQMQVSDLRLICSDLARVVGAQLFRLRCIRDRQRANHSC